nr:MAG TPA: hypothetical protein [Caudoviricetes sp.]
MTVTQEKRRLKNAFLHMDDKESFKGQFCQGASCQEHESRRKRIP